MCIRIVFRIRRKLRWVRKVSTIIRIWIVVSNNNSLVRLKIKVIILMVIIIDRINFTRITIIKTIIIITTVVVIKIWGITSLTPSPLSINSMIIIITIVKIIILIIRTRILTNSNNSNSYLLSLRSKAFLYTPLWTSIMTGIISRRRIGTISMVIITTIIIIITMINITIVINTGNNLDSSNNMVNFNNKMMELMTSLCFIRCWKITSITILRW